MFTDIANLFLSPVALFSSLREAPRWRGALVVLLIVVTLGTLLTLDIITETVLERGEEEVRARGGGGQDVSGILGHPAMKGLIVVAAPAAILVFLLAFSGVAYLFLSLSGGVDTPRAFQTVFRTAVWAKLVEIPHMLLWVPLVRSERSPEIFFGPAALLSPEAPENLRQLLGALDLFTVWFLVLFVLGVRILLNVSAIRASLVIVAPWAAWQLVKYFI